MKLRSIVTAGLLGAGLLMMSGCDWLDDEVEDALPKAASVYVVNQTAGPLDVTVDGVTGSVASQGIAASFTPVTTSDTISVNSSVFTETSISSSGIHVIGVSTANCDTTNNLLIDNVGSEKIRVMNLSAAQVDSSTVTVKFTPDGGSQETITMTAVDKCKKGTATTSTGSTIGDWELTIGTKTYNQSLTKDIALEIVVYDTNIGTLIPLFGIDSL